MDRLIFNNASSSVPDDRAAADPGLIKGSNLRCGEGLLITSSLDAAVTREWSTCSPLTVSVTEPKGTRS